MTQTHISYKLSKALKEFLGKDAPEPMDDLDYYTVAFDTPEHEKFGDKIPCYALHDLLSKPFCEAFVKVGKVKFGFDEDEVTDYIADWSTEMSYAYWNGGLSAVEVELFKMMEGK